MVNHAVNVNMCKMRQLVTISSLSLFFSEQTLLESGIWDFSRMNIYQPTEDLIPSLVG